MAVAALLPEHFEDASGEEATQIKKQALSTYGTYRKHFGAFCTECDESLRAIGEAFKGF